MSYNDVCSLEQKNKTISRETLLLCLLLSIFMPVSIDIFLPVLPSVADAFVIENSEAQLIISVFLSSYGFSQILFGFMSDYYSREKTLKIGLFLFLVSALLCFFIQDYTALLVGRFFQGVGACTATISAYAIARDNAEGIEYVKILSYLAASMTMLAAAAPFIGSLINQHLGWQYIFIFLEILCLFAIIIAYYAFSNAPKKKAKEFTWHAIKSSYISILTNRAYITYVICSVSIFSALIIFLVSAPFIFIERLEITQIQFSILLAVNSFFLAFGGYLPSHLARHYSINAIITFSCTLMLLAAVGLFYAYYSNSESMSLLAIMMCLNSFSIGLCMPTSMGGAMQPFPKDSANATAIAGFVRFNVGALSGYVIGQLDFSVYYIAVLLGLIAIVNLLAVAALPQVKQ